MMTENLETKKNRTAQKLKNFFGVDVPSRLFRPRVPPLPITPPKPRKKLPPVPPLPTVAPMAPKNFFSTLRVICPMSNGEDEFFYPPGCVPPKTPPPPTPSPVSKY